MIYEERYTVTALGETSEYLQFYRQTIAQAVKTSGGEPLLLLTGLIGDRGNAVLQISRFSDYSVWQDAQKYYSTGREKFVDSEEVRLLKSIASRPKSVIPPEDKRPVYGYRKLFIHPENLEKFVVYSEKGVWPLYEACDCPVFGLFSPLWATNPLEIILMGSYRGPGHWEETRFPAGKPANVNQKLWETGTEMNLRRSSLIVRGSWVRLWKAHEI